MPDNSQDERSVITPDEARRELSVLPDGSYTLRDVTIRWPELLKAAMVLCEEATRQSRSTTFHSRTGKTTLHRTSASDPERPALGQWSGDAFSIQVRHGQPVRVSLVHPESEQSS